MRRFLLLLQIDLVDTATRIRRDVSRRYLTSFRFPEEFWIDPCKSSVPTRACAKHPKLCLDSKILRYRNADGWARTLPMGTDLIDRTFTKGHVVLSGTTVFNPALICYQAIPERASKLR